MFQNGKLYFCNNTDVLYLINMLDETHYIYTFGWKDGSTSHFISSLPPEEYGYEFIGDIEDGQDAQ